MSISEQLDKASAQLKRLSDRASAPFLKGDKKRDDDDDEASWQGAPRPRAWLAD